MSTPHLHTQRLLQDLDHLYTRALASLPQKTPENEATRDLEKRELSNINRRLKKELRRLGTLPR